MVKKNTDYTNIPKEKFEFYKRDESIHDKKLETKPVGYFKDAMRRFAKNKSSVVAAYIILALVLFAIFIPIFCENNYTKAAKDTTYLQYGKLLPKSSLFAWAGWDGCSKETLSEGDYLRREAIAVETGHNPTAEVYSTFQDSANNNATYYKVRTDSYLKNGMIYMTLSTQDYQAIQAWQNETGVQVIYPAVDTSSLKVATLKNDANIWYQCTNKGLPKLDKNGNFIKIYKTKGADDYESIRIAGDDGSYRYAVVGGTSTAKSYQVRVFTYTYFQYRYGHEPSFLFGTNAYGQDILTRLAKAVRFSILLALGVSAINLFLGAIYGAVEGYYGGAIDLIMERISDILSGVPFVVVVTLFQLHLASTVGVVISFLFAFVLTGWIGMAALTRKQFYRFKGQEYVLAARTLGASDARLIFKHIFPNSLGTIVTGAVMTIPGVIFSESMLSYLHIINLETSSLTSIGTLLSGGQAYLSTYPHIIMFPAIFIAILEIAFNLFGNGLRDALNPSLRGADD